MSCAAVYGLGFYTGSHTQERAGGRRGADRPPARDHAPPPAGQRAKAGTISPSGHAGASGPRIKPGENDAGDGRPPGEHGGDRADAPRKRRPAPSAGGQAKPSSKTRRRSPRRRTRPRGRPPRARGAPDAVAAGSGEGIAPLRPRSPARRGRRRRRAQGRRDRQRRLHRQGQAPRRPRAPRPGVREADRRGRSPPGGHPRSAPTARAPEHGREPAAQRNADVRASPGPRWRPNDACRPAARPPVPVACGRPVAAARGLPRPRGAGRPDPGQPGDPRRSGDAGLGVPEDPSRAVRLPPRERAGRRALGPLQLPRHRARAGAARPRATRSSSRRPAEAAERRTTDDPLGELQRLLGRAPCRSRRGLPRFVGGAVGYLGYDVVRAFERLPVARRGRPRAARRLHAARAERPGVRQRRRRPSAWCRTPTCGRGVDPDAAYDAAVARIDALIARLDAPAVTPARRRRCARASCGPT